MTPAFDHQDAVFAPAFEILQEAIQVRAFPGASAAVLHAAKLVLLRGLGRFTYDRESSLITHDTVFDLASVSKVVATTAMAMLLFERGTLALDSPVATLVPEFRGPDTRRDRITFRMLLAHSSGLPAYERLFERAHTRDQLLQACFAVPLERDPGTVFVYSDLGFIILGVALERLARESIDRFCTREIFGPLGMRQSCFCPPAEWQSRISPTVDDRGFRRRVVQGEVQDENAWVLGGVAGHAGAFSTAMDVAAFAHCMLNSGRPIFRAATVELFTRRQAGGSRALGWDTPSQPSQSGQYFSSHSFGHLGYTGTSLWADAEKRLAVVLLTNRTWPDCASQKIKEVRPRFHDAVVEALRGVS